MASDGVGWFRVLNGNVVAMYGLRKAVIDKRSTRATA
jgi:hypothetical protein